MVKDLVYAFQGIQGKWIKFDAVRDGYKVDPQVNIFFITIKNTAQGFHQQGSNRLSPGSCPRGATLGCWAVKHLIFSKHGHVAYQMEGNDEKNSIHVKLSP